ncbi:MAG: hypothetical protein ACYCWW_16430 [Deltaproteobacteria bacterium]
MPDETQKSSEAATRPGFFGKAKGELERVREAVVRSSQIGKIKLDSTFLRRERERLVAQLGEQALNLMLADRLPIPDELSPLVKEIEGVEGRIAASGKQVDEILKEGLEGAKSP